MEQTRFVNFNVNVTNVGKQDL